MKESFEDTRLSESGVRRGDHTDDSASCVHDADPPAERVGNIKVTVGIERQPAWTGQARLYRRLSIAVVIRASAPCIGHNPSARKLDDAHAVIREIGDV